MKDFIISYDAEFTGLHKDTTLISIGMISDTAFFYAEFTDYDRSQVDEWLKEHVIDNLSFNDKDDFISHIGGNSYSVIMKGNGIEVAVELLAWLRYQSESHNNAQIHILSDCYAYDWVLLNNLICDGGEAINTPSFINYIPIDFSTALYMANIDPDINRENLVGSDELLNDIAESDLFTNLLNGVSAKHNSLWDAIIVSIGFKALQDKLLFMCIRKYSNDVNSKMYVVKQLSDVLHLI